MKVSRIGKLVRLVGIPLGIVLAVSSPAALPHLRVHAQTPSDQSLRGAIVCANSDDPADLKLAWDPATATIGSQLTAGLSLKLPASLSAAFPESTVECGAAIVDPSAADPTMIPAGTVTFTITYVDPSAAGAVPTVGGGPSVYHILEPGDDPFSYPCVPAPAAPDQSSCLGGIVGPDGGSISPPPANVVHIGRRQGDLGSEIAPHLHIEIEGGYRPSGRGLFGFPPGDFTEIIPVAPPAYSMTLGALPQIPAASGKTPPVAITVSVNRPSLAPCVPLSGGLGLTGFISCPTPILPGAVVPPSALLYPSAEPGTITFSSTLGTLGLPGSPFSSGLLPTFKSDCGNPGPPPIAFNPIPGTSFNYSFTACLSATSILFGGSAVGSTVVTANYIGTLTGSTVSSTIPLTLPAANPTSIKVGCNEVVVNPTVPARTPRADIVSLVSPSGVVQSVWQYNDKLHAWDGGFFNASSVTLKEDGQIPAPNSDPWTGGYASAGEKFVICLNGPATILPLPGSSSSQTPSGPAVPPVVVVPPVIVPVTPPLVFAPLPFTKCDASNPLGLALQSALFDEPSDVIFNGILPPGAPYAVFAGLDSGWPGTAAKVTAGTAPADGKVTGKVVKPAFSGAGGLDVQIVYPSKADPNTPAASCGKT